MIRQLLKYTLLLLLLTALVWFAAWSANPPRAAFLATLKDHKTYPLWVTSNGWHTGIILRRADIGPVWLPEKSVFDGEIYLEMGWGDAGFYQAEQITPALAARALLKPSPSVVHLVGFSAPPKQYFAQSRIVALRVNAEHFVRLLRYLHHSIDRRATSHVTRKKGLYGNSRFFAGTGQYHAFNTCNHWAARALLTAGIPITPWYAAGTGPLMWQVQRYALNTDR